jgi:hypothetical protein
MSHSAHFEMWLGLTQVERLAIKHNLPRSQGVEAGYELSATQVCEGAV